MTWNIAICGAGERAQPYLTALGQRRDVQVTAVWDLDRRAAEQVAAGWGARVFLTCDSLLSETRPDALWVSLSPRQLGDVLFKAAELRVPFFVEPPGAADFAAARQCARAVEEARLVTAVAFPARFTDIFQEAREYLGANPVPLALGWWLNPPAEGGAMTAEDLLWAEGCRLVDALRFFCGDVTRVSSLSAGADQGGMVVQLVFGSGTVGVLTCAAYPQPEPRVELELLGDGWTLSFAAGPEGGTAAMSALRLTERDKTTILRRLNVTAADHVAAFLDAVAAGKPEAVATGYADALRTLAVCHAAMVSARQGRPVALEELEGTLAAPRPGGTGR